MEERSPIITCAKTVPTVFNAAIKDTNLINKGFEYSLGVVSHIVGGISNEELSEMNFRIKDTAISTVKKCKEEDIMIIKKGGMKLITETMPRIKITTTMKPLDQEKKEKRDSASKSRNNAKIRKEKGELAYTIHVLNSRIEKEKVRLMKLGYKVNMELLVDVLEEPLIETESNSPEKSNNNAKKARVSNKGRKSLAPTADTIPASLSNSEHSTENEVIRGDAFNKMECESPTILSDCQVSTLEASEESLLIPSQVPLTDIRVGSLIMETKDEILPSQATTETELAVETKDEILPSQAPVKELAVETKEPVSNGKEILSSQAPVRGMEVKTGESNLKNDKRDTYGIIKQFPIKPTRDDIKELERVLKLRVRNLLKEGKCSYIEDEYDVKEGNCYIDLFIEAIESDYRSKALTVLLKYNRFILVGGCITMDDYFKGVSLVEYYNACQKNEKDKGEWENIDEWDEEESEEEWDEEESEEEYE